MTKKSKTVELVSGFGKIKSCRGIYTVAALIITHRYEVSSRQHSGSCGEDAIIRIEDKKLLLRVILTKKENVCDFLLSNLFSEEDRRDE